MTTTNHTFNKEQQSYIFGLEPTNQNNLNQTTDRFADSLLRGTRSLVQDRSSQDESLDEGSSTTQNKNHGETTVKLDSIVNSVINKFIERAKFGKEKYGTDLDRTDLALYEWILHAQEEHMDAILYLEKIKKIIINNS